MALQRLRADARWNVVALLCSVSAQYQRVAMHGIRRAVLQAQAKALELPLIESLLPPAADNPAYLDALAASLRTARQRWPALQHIAFGDLFLADVRAWRERTLGAIGFEAVFPLWGEDTAALARSFCRSGWRAVLTCVDTTQLPAPFSGRDYDDALLDDLPAGVDPCGENGEFHTLVHAGPGLHAPLTLRRGDSVLRDGRFQYTDFELLPDS